MQNWEIAGFLPYVDLNVKEPIHIGPIAFSSNKIEENTASYAFLKEQSTCIFINNSVAQELKELLMVDGIYLLYFAAVYKELYLDWQIMPFNSFTYLVTAKEAEIFQGNAYFLTHVAIEEIPPDVLIGLGGALQTVYCQPNTQSADYKEFKRIIRAIRFFVDHFFEKFHNMLDGRNFHERFFEPENILFLTASFEALFDISAENSASDFKFKLRPLLHLKYGKPIEIFWKWVDGLYRLRQQIVHVGTIPDETFTLNRNFVITYSFYAVKLFIYAVYYKLFKLHMADRSNTGQFYPPHFKNLNPEELLVYLWPEKELLLHISLLMDQVVRDPENREAQIDLEFLTGLYHFMLARYGKNGREIDGLTFQPDQVKEIEIPLKNIQQHSNKIRAHLPEHFCEIIEERLAS